MATTLTEFLLARIADDETRYRNTAGDEQHQDWALNKAGDYNEAYIVEEALRHLAECEAKRRTVEWVTNAQRYAAEGQPGAFDPEDARALTHALRLLALPHADHPDYREEWRLSARGDA